MRGVELPFGTDAETWWVDEVGAIHDRPIASAEHLPGRFILPGLVDAHAHPALGVTPTGPAPLTLGDVRASLLAWAESGVTVVRDVGSPLGLTLDLRHEPGMPALHAAGRFLAPDGRYFPDVLVEGVAEGDLLDAALAETARGATWVKVIADFPDLAAGTDAESTYSTDRIAQLAAAVHSVGARVAVHSTLPDAGALVAAGVDSIEHGTGLDQDAIEEMARRGTAWTPTLCALFALADAPYVPEIRRLRAQEARERLSELLPLAARLGVPVMTGTDVAGTVDQEVALLSEMGLAPSEALAAASVWPRNFILSEVRRADIVTYDHDPREDPSQLRSPAAVVVGGTRVR